MTEKNGTETAEKQTPGIQNKTLKAAGYSYIVGDLAMATAGKLRGEPHTFSGAMTWMMGGIFAAIWGNPNPKHQLEIQASKLERHFKQKGIQIPDDARARSELLTEKSFLGKVSEFLYEHPSEMLNTMYAIGAAMMLHGSLKPGPRAKGFLPKSLNWEGLVHMNSNFWIGAVVLAGTGVGLLVKEDPEARKKAAGKGILHQAYAVVAEKPLRFTSALYGLNNVFLAAKLAEDWHFRDAVPVAGPPEKPGYLGKTKPHPVSALQLACYLFSNTMLFLSNRNQISDKGFSAEDVAKIENAAAHVIAAQSPEKQKELLADVAAYISKEKGIHRTAPEIAQQLADRITKITQERAQPAATEARWAHREQEREHLAETMPATAR